MVLRRHPGPFPYVELWNEPNNPNWLDLMFKRGAPEHDDVIGVHGFRGTWAGGGPSPARRGALVTGGAGSFGSALADRLLSSGTPVVVLDSLSRPGAEENVRRLKEARALAERPAIVYASLAAAEAAGLHAVSAQLRPRTCAVRIAPGVEEPADVVDSLLRAGPGEHALAPAAPPM